MTLRKTLVAALGAAALALPFVATQAHAEGAKANSFAVFLGATDAAHTDFTVGAEFEHRPLEWLGLGVIGEWTPNAEGSHDAKVAIAAIHLHPAQGLRLTGGVGLEFIHGHEEELFRLGATYEFEVGHFVIGPTANVDFVNGHENLVFGMIFGTHF